MLGPCINITIIKELALVFHLLIIAIAIQDSTRIWEVNSPIVFLQPEKDANRDVQDWHLLDPQAKVLNLFILNTMRVIKDLYLFKTENKSYDFLHIFTFR